MRYSQLFIPTLKDLPSEAKTPSHIFLIRAGYIRQVSAGIFSLLPLGMRVVQKIQAIVREELIRIGAVEVLLPMVHPATLWQESGRWQAYGSQLLRIKDRKGFDFALSPTAEEAMVALVRDDIKSYRKLPVHLFQIQDKFRDEARPRAGLLRGREFIMKDGYSFHADEADTLREYQATYQAYCRIFTRCGLDFRAVEADTGAIGGSLSHEFQVLADTGEDSIVSCDQCDYAANVEKAVLNRESDVVPAISAKTQRQEIHTPGVRSIQEVATFLGVPYTKLIKTLIYVADGKPVAALLRGDRHLNEPKFMTLLEASQLEPASESLIAQLTQADVGSLGPVGLNIPIYADWEIAHMGSCIAGANRTDYHSQGLILGRDFHATLVDIRVAATGDRCGRCQKGHYRTHRGIEVGHVFFLGTKYSAPMKCEFLDKDGQLRPMVMGTYGIGITRVMAATIEQRHDDKGIRWPMALSPFHAVIATLGKEPEIAALAEKLYQDLTLQGIEVLYDDRDERAGVKFADAELIGIPIRVTIGKRSLSEQKVEVKSRDGSLDTTFSYLTAADEISSLVKKELQAESR